MIQIKVTPKYKPPKVERVKKREFSKRCLVAMIFLWFLGALVGIGVVAVQVLRGDMTVSIGDVLMYIGAPMTGGIVSYMIKSAAENREKIKGQKPEEDNSI